MAVVSIESDADFSLQVLHKKGIVMAYFWASWCGPCKMIRSEIENVAEKMASIVHVVCINVDVRQEIAEKYDIMAVPTLLFFKDVASYDWIYVTRRNRKIFTKRITR